jgi:cytochrome c-type biogenesis protein CcmH
MPLFHSTFEIAFTMLRTCASTSWMSHRLMLSRTSLGTGLFARGPVMTRTLYASGKHSFIATLVMMAPFTTFAFAVTPDEVLQEPKLEMRARAISQDLRCFVCQNQNIDDSDAPLARDLRALVRDRLVSGDTDEQAVRYIAVRYGNFVLLNPPLQLNTLALWSGPAFFLLFSAVGFILHLHRRSADRATSPAEALTTAELKRIDELLGERRSK